MKKVNQMDARQLRAALKKAAQTGDVDSRHVLNLTARLALIAPKVVRRRKRK